MDDDKRPITLTAFEVLNVASVVFEIVVTETDSPFGEAFSSGLWVALTLWITRGRSRAARVIYSCLMAFGAASLIGAYSLGYVPEDDRFPLGLRFGIELAVFVTLLWWPSTSDWLKKRQDRVAV